MSSIKPYSPFKKVGGIIYPKVSTDILAAIVAPWYGVAWDESADTYVRTGALTGVSVGSSPGNVLLPIQASMRRCVISDGGVVQYYLDPSNSTLKVGGGTAVLTGADGQVMVEIPAFYYRYAYSGTTHTWEISLVPLAGFSIHPAFMKNGVFVPYRYIGAYEGVLYNVSAAIYANGLYLSAHNVGFISATKTIIHRTGTVATVNMTGAAAGSGYAVGNVLTLAGGTTGATVTVATIDGSGGVLTITLTTKGYGHTTGVKATTGGAGTGCTVNIATLATDLTNPYTRLEAGDKVTVSGSVSNNTTFTVVTPGDTSFTVSEAVIDEDYAVSTVIQTQKDWTATTGDKLASVSGKAPINQGTRANFRAAAKNRGAGWRQQEYDLISAIQLLYLVEYASFYSQSVVGAGITNVTDWATYNEYNPIAFTGNANSIGNATGNTAGAASALTESTKYLSYRGIENWFGHLWKWVDGININSNVPYVSNNDTQFADNTATNYIALGVTLGAIDGWQNTLLQQDRGFLPASVGATSTTKITDYYWQASGWRVGMLGGSAAYGVIAGACCWNLDAAAAGLYRNVSGRLSY